VVASPSGSNTLPHGQGRETYSLHSICFTFCFLAQETNSQIWALLVLQ
jgi:hypothetical protein